MSLVYIETSALVKRYIQEKGTEIIDLLFAEQPPDEFFATSMLSILEFKSVLRRLVKAKKIKESGMMELLSAFWKDRVAISRVLPVDNTLIEEAMALIDRHALKAADAIHFTSIERLKDIAKNTGHTFIVATSDVELVEACQAEGIEVLNPEESKALEKLKSLR